MSCSACRWKSERRAKKSIVRAKSDVVVDLRLDTVGDGASQIQELDVQRSHWVAKACHRTGATYLYVSSSAVFSGELDRPYVEEDSPDNDEVAGQFLARAERVAADACLRHLILRLGPVFFE
jgi:dTDP-4-dehydrorhamnose reductase